MGVAWLLPLHITLVSLSIAVFAWRGVYAWQGRDLPFHWLKRLLPDSLDSLLLLTGVLLAMSLHILPWQDAWLAAKLFAIVCYIALGVIAFRRWPSLWVNRVAMLCALLTLIYIVSVAYQMSALPWL